jgi:hypothetical protein
MYYPGAQQAPQGYGGPQSPAMQPYAGQPQYMPQGVPYAAFPMAPGGMPYPWGGSYYGQAPVVPAALRTVSDDDGFDVVTLTGRARPRPTGLPACVAFVVCAAFAVSCRFGAAHSPHPIS